MEIKTTDGRNIREMVENFFYVTGEHDPVISIFTDSRSSGFFFNKLSLMAFKNAIKLIFLESVAFFGVAEVVCKFDMAEN